MAKKTTQAEQLALFPELHLPPAPVNARPLFLPRLLREAAQDKALDVAARAAAQDAFRKWVQDLEAGVLHAQNETQVEQDFTKGLLGALGYQTSADVETGRPWTLQAKLHIPGAGTADAALGQFGMDSSGHLRAEPRVVIELEKAGKDLDRKESSGRTPVQQAWDYLNGSETAQWAIVSNYVEFRLYNRRKTPRHLYRVAAVDLKDPEKFAEFYAVFHAGSLLGTLGDRAERLLEETEQAQEKVGEMLYQLYDESRAALIEELRSRGVADLDTAIRTAQTLLDRILFIAFAEDRRLLPDERTLEHTADTRHPGFTRWNAFQALFRAIDQGDPEYRIPRYNGTLFKPNPILDDRGFALDSERWPAAFRALGQFDYRDEVTVDVLGRIFERSITDIEALKQDGHAPAAGPDARKTPGRRKLQGVFYTNVAIVEYLVAAALDPLWEAKRAELAAALGPVADGPEPPPAAFSRAMLAWLDTVAACDPACGSGAFLIGAFDWFEARRCELLADLQRAEPDNPEFAGDLADHQARSAPVILRNNLYGVDLSPESVEIAQLSLWIRTARPGQVLTDLSENVRRGNSLVDDPAADPDAAFAWEAQFPRVFARGGFDAVIGNPPYVRQERLAPLKPYLERAYRAYHGMADLYVYFYEKGLRLLRPGGRLAFVVTNKWMKAGYGEPLRRLFGAESWVESVVDFGHAKQFFKDADVFPCFLVARKPADGPPPETVRVCIISRDDVRPEDLRNQIKDQSIEVGRDRLGGDAWSLEPKGVHDLIAKIRGTGIPLSDFAGVKPYRGVVTGYNEAFLIDTPTRDALISEAPESEEVIRPFLRGQDINRWSSEWAGLWMIFARRGIGIDAYPAIKRHLSAYRERLEPKPKGWVGGTWQGRKPGAYEWYEIQDPVEYWPEFDKPKLVYQEIQFHPSYALDASGHFGNNKIFFIPSSDLYLLGVLNSPLLWWHNWRYLPHMKDEALSPMNYLTEKLPIAKPSDDVRGEMEGAVSRIIEITQGQQRTRRDILDWLQVQYEVAAPSQRLRDPAALDSDAFVAEVRRLRGKKKPLSVAALKALRDEYARTIDPLRSLTAEARALEVRIGDLVHAAYGLTPDEVRLMWDTAPPRMPTPRPPGP